MDKKTKMSEEARIGFEKGAKLVIASLGMTLASSAVNNEMINEMSTAGQLLAAGGVGALSFALGHVVVEGVKFLGLKAEEVNKSMHGLAPKEDK